MNGINSVKMSGYLMYPKSSQTASGYPKFTGKLSIPVTYDRGGEKVEGKSFHNICAFGPAAEGLSELMADTPIQIDGVVNTRSYEGKCKHCSKTDKKYWTEVQVHNFIVLTE